jgi:putative tricarboxylic transport membrane protein
VGTRRAPERLLSVLVGADYGALLRLNSSSGDAREDGQELREPGTLDSVLKVLCPAVAAEALMHVIGLYVASALYIGFYMRWVGRHSWVSVLTLGIGIPVVTFLVFKKWFLVAMPKGPLEGWLGY